MEQIKRLHEYTCMSKLVMVAEVNYAQLMREKYYATRL